MKKLFAALSSAVFLLGCLSAQAQSTREVPPGSGQRFQGVLLIDPSTGQPYAATGGGSGGGGGSSGPVYGPTPIGTAPGQPPLFLGYKDAAGLTAGASPSTQIPAHDYDLRATGQTLSSAAGSFIDIPIDGKSIVGLRFSGLTASGATITYLSSNDATQTPASPISSLNASTGVLSGTRTTDGETRIPVSARTTLRLQVTTAGTGTITVSYNVSRAGTVVDLGSPLPPGANAIGSITNTAFGISGLLPGFSATPTFNIGTAPTLAMTEADGANSTLGSKADAANAATGSTAMAVFRQLHADLLAPTPAGTSVIGKVGIDQTTNGSTNGVYITGGTPTLLNGQALPGSSAGAPVGVQGVNGGLPVLVSTNQATHGTTDKVAADLYVAGAANTSANPIFVQTTSTGAGTYIGQVQQNSPTTLPFTTAEQGSSAATAGITPAVTQAGTTLLAKASQGNLYSIYAVNTTTTAGYLVCVNSTATITGAIAPLDVAYLAGSVGATAQINYGSGPPDAYSTGISCGVTASLTTFTAGGTSFISARVR